jgi:hypothetical protein
MFSDERSQLISDRLKQYGHDFEMGDLIYHEKRNAVIEYLEGHGWDVSARKMPDAYADNGFEFPEDGAIGFFATRAIRPSSFATAAVVGLVTYSLPMGIGAWDAYQRAQQQAASPKFRIDYTDEAAD